MSRDSFCCEFVLFNHFIHICTLLYISQLIKNYFLANAGVLVIQVHITQISGTLTMGSRVVLVQVKEDFIRLQKTK